jgi:hypothetical protein
MKTEVIIPGLYGYEMLLINVKEEFISAMTYLRSVERKTGNKYIPAVNRQYGI